MADTIAEKDYTSVNFTMVDDLTTEWSSTASEFAGSIQPASSVRSRLMQVLFRDQSPLAVLRVRALW